MNFSIPHQFIIVVSCMVTLTGNFKKAGSQITITRGTEPLPGSVDNRDTPYFPPIISQTGNSCASAASIGYVCNYELNAARDQSVDEPANSYSFFATYNFLNDGSPSGGTYLMYLDAWKFVRDNGIISRDDFGEPDSRATKWIDGYDKYYRGMSNRITAIDSLSFNDEHTLALSKQWLFDHGNDSRSGGVFLFLVSYAQIQYTTLRSGPGSGKHIMRFFGKNQDQSPHDLTVVGYNDSILYDFNNDGVVTVDEDINSDGTVDLADAEVGAFIVANSWGTNHLDGGCFYAPYRLFATPQSDGGIHSNKVYFINVAEDYFPERTFKVTITHQTRNALGLSVGVSSDSTATEPTSVRQINQFDHAGGAHPMQGYGADATLEFGLDITDLKDSVSGNQPTAYFLIIDADDDNGSCDALSLMDYTTDPPVEYSMSDIPRQLGEGATTLRIPVPMSAISPTMHTRRQRPNIPVINVVNNRIHLASLPGTPVTVHLYQTDGTLLLQRQTGSSRTMVTAPLATGTYFLRIFDTKAEWYTGPVTVIP